MCKTWFPDHYLDSIWSFLRADVESLDVGVGAQLRDIAFHQRSEQEALRWMASEPVQDFLEDVANGLFCHSLDVERRGAQVKHWESSKVTHIGTASCAKYMRAVRERAGSKCLGNRSRDGEAAESKVYQHPVFVLEEWWRVVQPRG